MGKHVPGLGIARPGHGACHGRRGPLARVACSGKKMKPNTLVRTDNYHSQRLEQEGSVKIATDRVRSCQIVNYRHGMWAIVTDRIRSSLIITDRVSRLPLKMQIRQLAIKGTPCARVLQQCHADGVCRENGAAAAASLPQNQTPDSDY